MTSTGQAYEFNEGEGGAAFQPILKNLKKPQKNSERIRRRTWSSPAGNIFTATINNFKENFQAGGQQ